MDGDCTTRFGVIADDLTGAMDAGAGFLGMGLRPIVTFGGRLRPDAAVVVISTDSRDMGPEAAYRTVLKQAGKLAGLQIYKKIDSTLRGNVGKEIEAVMDALRLEKAVVCPAFPANGRTVVGGRLMVGGRPIDETSFSKDPFHTAEASIPALLHTQTGMSVGCICLDEVDKGPDRVVQKIADSNYRAIVIDAADETHLRCIALALSRNAAWLPCGSAGLARELPFALGCKPAADGPYRAPGSTRPVLAAVGSRNSVTIEQIRTAEERVALEVISVEPDNFVDRRGRLTSLGTLTGEVAESLGRGRSVLLTTSLRPYVPELRQACARLLAAAVSRTVRRFELAGLLLAGGDIARETCRALGVSGIRILTEIEPGVVLGEESGTRHGLRIVTKAGGFGGRNTLANAIRRLRGEEDGK